MRLLVIGFRSGKKTLELTIGCALISLRGLTREWELCFFSIRNLTIPNFLAVYASERITRPGFQEYQTNTRDL